MRKRSEKYLLKSTHHVPTVIGPANGAGKRFYITDHHHLSHALMVANEEKYTDVDALYACILTNRKQDETDSFWSFMVHNHLTWLDDENGKAITPGDLEKRAPDLKDLQNDAYRTWSRWVRDSCGYVKAGNDCVPPSYPADAAYFMEFLWADYLEQNMPGNEKIDKLSDQEITKLLEQAIALAQQPQAYLENLPGYSDGTVIPAARGRGIYRNRARESRRPRLGQTGKVTTNSLPWPRPALCPSSTPPCCATSCRARASPTPSPSALAWIGARSPAPRAKRPYRPSRSSALMPMPSSCTRTTAFRPSWAKATRM